MSEKSSNTGAGKGDKPRNCFTQKYRDNYDSIDWDSHKKEKKEDDEKYPYYDVAPTPRRM